MGVKGSTPQDNKLFGFRLYKIFPGGPLAESGLSELDEFIIPPEEVIYNKISFYEYLKSNLNKKISLNVYSVIRRFFYTIEVTPRNDWGDPKYGFLGACVRYENWSTAHTNLLRVIKVNKDSIAERILNLIPNDDYIISIRPENKDFISLNNDTSDPMTIFQEVLNDNIANFIEMFIYNVKTGSRNVKLFLEQRNGEILGCDVAYGKLHELPKKLNEEKDKNLIYKEASIKSEIEESTDNKNLSRQENYVFEKTKKILIENISKNKNHLNNLDSNTSILNNSHYCINSSNTNLNNTQADDTYSHKNDKINEINLMANPTTDKIIKEANKIFASNTDEIYEDETIKKINNLQIKENEVNDINENKINQQEQSQEKILPNNNEHHQENANCQDKLENKSSNIPIGDKNDDIEIISE